VAFLPPSSRCLLDALRLEPGARLAMARPLGILMLILAVAISLSACGVRGPLEPPPGSAATDAGPVEPGQSKPHEDFVLDGIL
jgi:predicted small lipoprotein YifL